ncbi:elongation of fatty acids protein 2 [[Candida] jaroonii]|uniref:Elongation of fatty acids protein 2 n=1 Tax=[Candida] jaroonii TaxID=467808 RepID=A0ACA9YD20_9ASCO|nr:elongation of fatty acids protein 2 [[Candida] jaroonii]
MSFPFPTPETPFGVKLFPIFNEIVSTVTGGKWVPSKFQWIEGEVPLSTLPPALIMVAVYYTLVFGGNYIFKKFKLTPLVLNGPFQIHNIFLTSLSFTLLILMVEQVFPMIYYHGLYWSICSPKAWTQEMELLYYLNYITKYIEFIDTLFLVVKQKKLTFLHTYHHGATALLCYSQLVGKTSISWVVISLNLFVHVVMYFYYFLAARGIRVWWKEWVTRFQIMQFILDLGFVYFATYNKLVDEYFTNLKSVLPTCGSCAGSMGAAYAGCGILSSYLVLFISFYIEVYKKKGTTRSKRVKSVSGGVAAQVNEFVHTTGRDSTPVVESQVRSRKA